ncbi:hypothetical protein GWK47_012212 [Chionoecetes opilio]|uniref:Uncharacterized protein n=1 Tax=Chionoecetes opilio TaxID=41210 RepID=A0A8J4Y1G5_CHIOP|nr:hypothetical protein GWK47_012212 [Chionoecetes opilio]
MKYLPGKRNCAADALSRFPSIKAVPDMGDTELEDDLHAAVCAATVSTLIEYGCITMDEDAVSKAAAVDPGYQMLISEVQGNEWHPHKSHAVACLRPYFSVRDRLAVVVGLVTYTFDQGYVRLAIPESLCHCVAANLHAGHQGLDSMLRRAR